MTAPQGGKDGADPRIDPRLSERIDRLLIGSPVACALGITLHELAVDRAVLSLPFKKENVTVEDIVHGGVIAAFIDVAGVAAALSGADFETLRGSATSSLSISYLAPARSVALRADALVLRRGRRQVVIDVTVAAGTLAVAKALATTSLF
ncbi:MAG: PaaI family thioesterase [Hyphomicrobiales bacterium]|nr:PaaI family thioesterase [Hyphomicrobiales bacterium]MBV9977652.1 PaaI family thioesterase [Hyphomicrobiales bacterium]